MSDVESISERELAADLAETVFAKRPRSVGEALAAADEAQPEPTTPEEVPEPPVEEPPVVVTDTPEQPEEDTEEGQKPPPVPAEPAAEPEAEVAEEDTEADENVVWAKKKYGDDPAKWAKAGRDMERHISQFSNEKREAEQLAQQWYEYAQQAEQQAGAQAQAGMPLSAQEEEWIESSLGDPLGYARSAAFNGNVNLFNGVLNRVAEENPMLASQIGTQVQMDLMQAAQYEQAQYESQQVAPEAQLPIALAQSFVRLGIDLEQSGPPMSEKIGELGEYHPYVQAILNGDERQRDLAVQAVYDLMRSTSLTKRVVRDEARAEQIRREGELRREAAGVVTGAPHTPPPATDPFMAAMEQEWKDRGQWGEE